MSAGAHPGARRHPQDIWVNRGPAWGSYSARHTRGGGTCRRLDLSRGWVRTSAFRRVLLCSGHNAGAAGAVRHSFLPHFSKPHCRTHRRVRRRIGGYPTGSCSGRPRTSTCRQSYETWWRNSSTGWPPAHSGRSRIRYRSITTDAAASSASSSTATLDLRLHRSPEP